jgi:hypothetical protein
MSKCINMAFFLSYVEHCSEVCIILVQQRNLGFERFHFERFEILNRDLRLGVGFCCHVLRFKC